MCQIFGSQWGGNLEIQPFAFYKGVGIVFSLTFLILASARDMVIFSILYLCAFYGCNYG